MKKYMTENRKIGEKANTKFIKNSFPIYLDEISDKIINTTTETKILPLNLL